MGELLPDDKDHARMETFEGWRTIFFYFPVGFHALYALTLLLFVTYEPIKYNLTKGNHEEACYAVRRMYAGCTEDNQDLYVEKIRQSSGSDFSGLTVKDALVDPQYRTATWVNVGYIIFHELTGINVINLYSTTIFKNMQTPGQKTWLTPRRGTYLVGATQVVFCLSTSYIVKCFGRKTLLIWGHIAIAVIHASVGVFNIFHDIIRKIRF